MKGLMEINPAIEMSFRPALDQIDKEIKSIESSHDRNKKRRDELYVKIIGLVQDECKNIIQPNHPA